MFAESTVSKRSVAEPTTADQAQAKTLKHLHQILDVGNVLEILDSPDFVPRLKRSISDPEFTAKLFVELQDQLEEVAAENKQLKEQLKAQERSAVPNTERGAVALKDASSYVINESDPLRIELLQKLAQGHGKDAYRHRKDHPETMHMKPEEFLIHMWGRYLESGKWVMYRNQLRDQDPLLEKELGKKLGGRVSSLIPSKPNKHVLTFFKPL